MDIQSKDILKQLLERMDNQQRKLDQVMERLDTVEHILERQSQKQNLLDEMLLQLTIKSDSEKVVTTEQIQGAQQNLIESFCVIDTPGKSTLLFPYETTDDWSKRIDDKLILIEDRTVDTAQKCRQLTLWSHKMEDKITQLADNSGTIKMLLVEIMSFKGLIRRQTNSEIILLYNQLDQKLSDIGVAVKDFYQQQMEMKEETVHSSVQVVKTGIQQGNEPLSDEQNLTTEILRQTNTSN